MADEPTGWRRSSRCEAHNCLEVAFMPDGVLVRVSRAPDAPVLRIETAYWRLFCQAVKSGRLSR